MDDFVSSARFLDHLSLVREYAPRGHLRFLERACAVRDVPPEGEPRESEGQEAK